MSSRSVEVGRSRSRCSPTSSTRWSGRRSELASWGPNVYVKIPITNTRGESSAKLIRSLSEQGVNVNVTAMMTEEQVRTAVDSLADGPAGYVSVFAGRIADSGRDPLPTMRSPSSPPGSRRVELIWASPREILNVVQAAEIGCDIITVTHDLLKKLPSLGRDLDQFSLDTVEDVLPTTPSPAGSML